MRIGVNLTGGDHLALVRDIARCGQADFIEILIDNFLSVDAEAIRESLDGIPVALHVMSSRFLERSVADLAGIARLLRRFIRDLSPLYVSDHIAQFTRDGRLLPQTQEIVYDEVFEHAVRRTLLWQDLLGARVLLENFPSVMDRGSEQIPFFQSLLSATGAGLLFDVSNAVVAEANMGFAAERWLPLAAETRHLHIAGYRQSEGITVDSHDCEISHRSLALLHAVASSPDLTLVVERDGNREGTSWIADLRTAKAAHAQ